jgi:glycosyltransferase involved in cell wall biosynthesis
MTSQHVNQPLVSILVPAYNAASTIADTLRSALDQSYPAIEVIVVDDGSQDETARIVQVIADSDTRIRFIHQVNQGVASARNMALGASSGGFIAPLDADDLWHRDKIARQVRRFAESGSRVGVVYCWSSDIDSLGQITAHRLDRDYYEGNVLAALVVANFIDTSSVPLIRRAELLAVGGWNANLHARGAQGCEDWHLYIQLAGRCNFALEPSFLVGYRRSPNAMSSNIHRMRKSYKLVMAEVHRTHPHLPAKVYRWSQAAFNVYIASLLGRSAPLRCLWFFAQGILQDPAWLFRRSTRKRFRSLISRRLGRNNAKAGPQPASAIGLPFATFVPEPEREISEGRWIAQRRRWLVAFCNSRNSSS